MQPGSDDPAAVAMLALAWVLATEERAERFLALTGLTPGDLRAHIADAALHRVVFDFLAGHEPDLLAAAAHIGVSPLAIIAAKEALA